MKVYRLPGKQGIKSTVLVTMIGADDARKDPLRSSVNSPTTAEASTFLAGDLLI